MAPRLGFFFFSSLALVGACGASDEFEVGEQRPNTSREEEEAENSAVGGGKASGSGGDNGSGGEGDGSGPNTGGDGAGGLGPWFGTRVGPDLESSPSPELGGMNGDLVTPMRCEELPVNGCMHFSGMWDETPIEGSCVANTFENDEGFMTCTGEGFSFGVNLPGFTGAPPSTFDILVSDMAAPNIGFEWDAAGFRSHGDEHEYLLSERYELQTRASGAVYELVKEDETRIPFVEMMYAVTYTPRPTCGGCPKIRLLGYFTAPTVR